ncbi:MAG: hypothetical protein F4210_10815 [Holophagales bacterium]|nr:hypothetical protein [Holophagales bacterium]MYF95979.1 hypothetical protein [Holophagales bacterium]
MALPVAAAVAALTPLATKLAELIAERAPARDSKTAKKLDEAVEDLDEVRKHLDGLHRKVDRLWIVVVTVAFVSASSLLVVVLNWLLA